MLSTQDDADTILLLISNGADVHLKLRRGGTCLHEAILHERVKAIQTLLRKGADPHAVDTDGMSCMDLAEERALPAVLTLLVGAAVSSCVDNALEALQQRQVCLL
jgi:ankyrin repeat protein